MSDFQILASKDADAFIASHQGEIFILDVRTPQEFHEQHLENAVNISIQSLPLRLEEIPKDAILLIYCAHGIRSGNAAEYLSQLGYSRVYHLQGGLVELLKQRSLS